MNKTTTDIWYLTGPRGPFTNSINEILTPFYNKKTNNLYFENDSDLNNVLNVKTNATRCRFYGVDMESFANFKHEYSNYLYEGHTHWIAETAIFK